MTIREYRLIQEEPCLLVRDSGDTSYVANMGGDQTLLQHIQELIVERLSGV